MEYYICAGVTLISAVLGTVFSIGAVVKGKGKDRENALYMFARSLALVGIALVPVFMEVNEILILITGAMLLIQVIDGCIGIAIKSRMRTAGPFIMAAGHAICLFTII